MIGLVSNKSDQLAEEITEAEAHLLAKEEALLSFDCSAKTGQGVEEILANLGTFILRNSGGCDDDCTRLTSSAIHSEAAVVSSTRRQQLSSP